MKYPAILVLLLISSCYGYSQSHKPGVTRLALQTNSPDTLRLPVDTTLSGSQIHLPLYQVFSSWSELGNTGLPAVANHFRPIRSPLDPSFFEGADGYRPNPNQLIYYRASSPFSMLNYNSGGVNDNNGQTIRAIYGTDSKRDGNITVYGNYTNSDGHFAKQKCNSSGLYANYLLNRDRYSLAAGIIRTYFNYSENGGLASDDQLVNAAMPLYLPVNLSGGVTKMSLLTFHGVQTIRIPRSARQKTPPEPLDSIAAPDSALQPPFREKFRITHSFDVTNRSRHFNDNFADAGFYAQTYSQDSLTADSLSFLSWTNDISFLSDSVHIGSYPFRLNAGINPDFFRYRFQDSVLSGYGIGINGRIIHQRSRSSFELAGKWTLLGSFAGDYEASATYRVSWGADQREQMLSLRFHVNGYSADPVVRFFQSTHFIWDNHFVRQHEAGLNAEWNHPLSGTRFSAGVTIDQNRIYFDSNGYPSQLQGQMITGSAEGARLFRAGPFRSHISLLVQKSTSGIIRLPLFVGSASTYLHHDLDFPKYNGHLELEYGFDANYTSAFYGYAFMPATGVFMPEDDKLLGNYPRLDFFAQFKLKRTRVFFAWCQTLSDIMPEQSFMVLHYPLMRPHFKYGIYWHFYD